MKNCNGKWSIEYLISLSDRDLEGLGRKVAGNLTVGKVFAGRVIIAMQRKGLAAKRGFSGPLHYFVAQGVPYVEARECRRVAAELEALPLLAAAAEQGTIGWTYLREVVRVASAQTEAQWLGLCGKHTSRQIQRLVKRTRAGESPLEAGWEPPEPVETELRVTLDALGNELFARVTRQLSQRAGRPLSPRDVVECLVAHYLTGNAFPGEHLWGKMTEEARRDMLARHEAEVREVAEMRAAARRAAEVAENSREFSEEGEEKNSQEFFRAPWAAVAATEEPCPGEPDLEVVRPAPPSWQNDRLRFNAEARRVTEAQRQELLRRDAYRCSCPDCPNHLWLEVHHLVYWCEGGVTVPANLLIVCSACHARLHRGLLRVERLEDGSLRWTDADGRELGALVPEGCLEECWDESCLV